MKRIKTASEPLQSSLVQGKLSLFWQDLNHDFQQCFTNMFQCSFICFSVYAGHLDQNEIQTVSDDQRQEIEHTSPQWELGRLGDVPSPNQTSEDHRTMKTSLLGRDIYFLFYYDTVCPISSDPFYIVCYYIQWVTTSWTHSTNLVW